MEDDIKDEYYSIKIPINPSRADVNQFASEAVSILSEGKLHRHLSRAVEKACNKKDTDPDKTYMPFEVMSTYCTVLLDMSMDRSIDERFALEVTLDLYNKANPNTPFTEQNFKDTKYDKKKGMITHLKNRVEDHPHVIEMKQAGVWKKPKIGSLSEMVTYIKRTTATFKELENIREKAELMENKALRVELDMVNLKAQYGSITEPERKQYSVLICKQYGLKQPEAADILEIGIATVKRYWNTS